jgi:hypothetical protein
MSWTLLGTRPELGPSDEAVDEDEDAGGGGASPSIVNEVPERSRPYAKTEQLIPPITSLIREGMLS